MSPMKKYLFTFVGIILLFIIGCADSSDNQSSKSTDGASTPFETVNNFAGVTMTSKEGSITSTQITLIFENNTDKQGIYGDEFFLEQEIDGHWYEVPTVIEEYGFNDIGYELNPGATEEMTTEWEWLYGKLDAGAYRIIKSVSDYRMPGDFDKYYLAATFTID